MYGDNEDRIKAIENSLEAVKDTLRNVTGSPVIRAHSAIRFDLNDNMNVLELNNTVKRLEERVAALERRDG